jgi:hypothetical protein
MAEESPIQERRGTRKLLMWTAIICPILLVAVLAWPLLPSPQTGNAPTGARDSADRTVGAAVPPAQQGAESTLGKADLQRPEDQTGGKARDIQRTTQPLQLTPEQRDQLRSVLSKQQQPRASEHSFEMMIGAAVPRQVELKDLPQEVTSVMNGYAGAQYTLVRDSLVIVDAQARRIVAIVPGMS